MLKSEHGASDLQQIVLIPKHSDTESIMSRSISANRNNAASSQQNIVQNDEIQDD